MHDEKEKVRITKNPTILVLKWIWGVLGCWLLLIPTIQAIAATVKYKTTEYAVTNKNAMEKYGWLSTHTDSMPLNKIENITVTIPFFGKIFNYGNVRIQGANHNDINFTHVKQAEAVKRAIMQLIG